jgi:hypothetical protein
LGPSTTWRLDAILKTAMATVKCASTQNASRTLSKMMSHYPPMSFRPVEYLIAPDSHFSMRQPLTHAPSARLPETGFRSGHILRVRLRGTYPSRETVNWFSLNFPTAFQLTAGQICSEDSFRAPTIRPKYGGHERVARNTAAEMD